MGEGFTVDASGTRYVHDGGYLQMIYEVPYEYKLQPVSETLWLTDYEAKVIKEGLSEEGCPHLEAVTL